MNALTEDTARLDDRLCMSQPAPVTQHVPPVAA
jgi:hypothetical protein